MNNFDLFINEDAYQDLDVEAAVAHLSEAIKCNTTGYVDTDKIDYSEFDRLHELMKESFPKIFELGEFELIHESVLIHLKGSDNSLKPALFMSHQDVVPVIKGTENDWTYDAFSGAVADGYVWGRGTLDIKNQVFGTMEAVEYLLERGVEFKRDIYLAFGEDEETLNRGAYNMGQLLKERGVELEYVLDEGGGKPMDAAVYGAPGKTIMSLGMYEKGYADLKIKAFSKGGHSSRPFHGTSLGKLAQAIVAIVNADWKAVLPETVKKTLMILKDSISEEPMKTYVSDIDAYEQEIIEYFLSKEALFNQVKTTVAPTMISEGSQAGNVMPQNMEAGINFRMAPQDSIDSVLSKCKEVSDPELELSFVQANEASRPSRTDRLGYEAMVASMSRFYQNVIFVPSLSVGATDAQHYECICDCCIRRSPFVEDNAITSAGVHGTNERISIRAYVQGIKVLIDLISNTCCA